MVLQSINTKTKNILNTRHFLSHDEVVEVSKVALDFASRGGIIYDAKSDFLLVTGGDQKK